MPTRRSERSSAMRAMPAAALTLDSTSTASSVDHDFTGYCVQHSEATNLSPFSPPYAGFCAGFLEFLCSNCEERTVTLIGNLIKILSTVGSESDVFLNASASTQNQRFHRVRFRSPGTKKELKKEA
ncbi:unnamed protein product [Cyprideis torosa]|uniref:Uncharacterized protein n=1 Tax=Cyprideis torosa TaxID=163714 RepID=A0A7R8ZMX4_9CRUS|nr:unnamed protein product [Cyprideis torosa]CAG0886587.1 unnamed protein product [Cyprideis torosa]